MNERDVSLLDHLMRAPIEDIKKAGIAPNYDMIEVSKHNNLILPKKYRKDGNQFNDLSLKHVLILVLNH